MIGFQSQLVFFCIIVVVTSHTEIRRLFAYFLFSHFRLKFQFYRSHIEISRRRKRWRKRQIRFYYLMTWRVNFASWSNLISIFFIVTTNKLFDCWCPSSDKPIIMQFPVKQASMMTTNVLFIPLHAHAPQTKWLMWSIRKHILSSIISHLKIEWNNTKKKAQINQSQDHGIFRNGKNIPNATNC